MGWIANGSVRNHDLHVTQYLCKPWWLHDSVLGSYIAAVRNAFCRLGMNSIANFCIVLFLFKGSWLKTLRKADLYFHGKPGTGSCFSPTILDVNKEYILNCGTWRIFCMLQNELWGPHSVIGCQYYLSKYTIVSYNIHFVKNCSLSIFTYLLKRIKLPIAEAVWKIYNNHTKELQFEYKHLQSNQIKCEMKQHKLGSSNVAIQNLKQYKLKNN